jgi:hypothetical protein
MALAIVTTFSASIVTPQRPAPTVDLDEAFDLVPCLRRRRQVGHVVHVVDTADGARAQLGQRARRSILAGSRTWFETSTSLMPPRAKTSASDTFWQQTPTGAAQLLLKLGHIDRFVHLAVHAVAHAVGLGIIAHLLDVALQRVEVEDRQGVWMSPSSMPGRAGMS